MIGLLRAEKGCLQCDFRQSTEDENEMPITEMSSRIEQLKNDRPNELTSQRKNIDNGLVDMHGKYVLRTRLSYTGLYGKESWPMERKVWEKSI